MWLGARVKGEGSSQFISQYRRHLCMGRNVEWIEVPRRPVGRLGAYPRALRRSPMDMRARPSKGE